MKPAPFEYFAPNSLDEALEIKAKLGEEAKPLAGGQSLIPAMNFRVAQPSALVDLNKIDKLGYIRKENGELHIGAMTRQSEVEHSPLVAEFDPLLHETVPHIAHPQIRNRGTFGGSLAHADPASELPVIALARDARLRVQGKAGERWVNAADFFQGMFTVDVGPEEFLVEVALPEFPERTGWSFMEVARRQGDYAMAGVAALVTLNENGVCEKARLVFLNVGDGPVEAMEAAQLLQGEKISENSIEAAAARASQDEITPFGNVHATPDFQRHLTHVLTRRALELAHQRAQAQLPS